MPAAHLRFLLTTGCQAADAHRVSRLKRMQWLMIAVLTFWRRKLAEQKCADVRVTIARPP